MDVEEYENKRRLEEHLEMTNLQEQDDYAVQNDLDEKFTIIEEDGMN